MIQRETLWQRITTEKAWDVVVIGGGITGAGILREAVRAGLTALLIEQHDFASGTSSRSSKMVHGGLRYLKQMQIGLMLQSIRQREALLKSGTGLIDPLGFLIPAYEGDSNRFLYQAGLTLYDLMALQWGHRQFNAADFEMLAPHIDTRRLSGGYTFNDAQTDDARLVLRIIQEAISGGGTALNYVRATELLRDDQGQVKGVIVRDCEGDRQATLQAGAVINATGAWADHLRQQVDAEARMRPLRGSHLVFPAWRLPVAQAVSFTHPADKRPVFAFPWEGVTLVGTTDIDHSDDLNSEPRISGEEVAYLLAACHHQFPSLDLVPEDIIATFAGVRPVIGTGKEDPSKESRDHVVWDEHGLLTVTGGKLTTFRLIALDALSAVQDRLPEMTVPDKMLPALDAVSTDLPAAAAHLDDATRQRLIGRYGAQAGELIAAAQPGELNAIPGTKTLWAELRHAAQSEQVVHLGDLMLRRTRLGILLPEGGASHLPRIRKICQDAAGWDDARWEREERAYLDRWQSCYSLPARESIPDTFINQPHHEDNSPVTEADLTHRYRLPLLLAAGGVLIALILWRWQHTPAVSSVDRYSYSD